MSKHNMFCCSNMESAINECEIICYNDVFDEYGITCVEDKVSYIILNYCPWCGKKLPYSKREQWFEELEKMGYEDPFLSDNIPSEYKSAEWRIKNTGGRFSVLKEKN